MRMGKQKEEKEKRGERRTRMGPGAWLLGTTARHSEMKPDAEEGGRLSQKPWPSAPREAPA